MTDETALLAKNLSADSVINDFPLSLIVYARDGMLVAMNPVAESFWGGRSAEIVGAFNILTDPQSVAQGSPHLFARVMNGERIETPPARYDTTEVALPRTGDRVFWIQATMFPFYAPEGTISHVAIIHRDVTDSVEQEAAMHDARAEIANQREAITTLASPVVEVWTGILTVPLVGLIDAHRAQVITEQLLNAIVRYSADVVILDVTGVPVVDTAVAHYLLIAAKSAMLLGSEVALVGLKSEIAQTLVHIGVDLSYLVTRANLKAGIAWAFERHGLRIVSDRPRARNTTLANL